MEKLFALQRFILSVPLDEVTKVDKDKETRCLEKKAWRGEQQKLDAGRSVSHGRPRDLAVEEVHFPWAFFTL